MVLLVDDDVSTNFLHKRTIGKVSGAVAVKVAQNGRVAIELLQKEISAGCEPPKYIFLDINMPELDGWGFLEAYKDLPQDWRSKTRVFMLTTSLNPDDHSRARSYSDVVDIIDKILTQDKLESILAVHGALA